jgi:hypothetical protein
MHVCPETGHSFRVKTFLLCCLQQLILLTQVIISLHKQFPKMVSQITSKQNVQEYLFIDLSIYLSLFMVEKATTDFFVWCLLPEIFL